MTDRVLVPFDFSAHARRALALAMQGFPFGRNVEIELLHVIDEGLYENVLARRHIPSDDAIAGYLHDELDRIRAELAISTGGSELLTPAPHIVRGRPYAIIDARLREPEVVGVLMGGQGHGGGTELLLGRTAQRVIRHAEIPVLVVKQPEALALPTRLLAAVDWSASAARALQFGARLRGQIDGLLSIVHVIDSPFVPYVQAFASEHDADEALDQVHADQRDRLATFVRETIGATERSVSEVVVFGEPGRAIAEQAARSSSQLVVVGMHGAANLSRFLLGSTADKLIAAAGCDVLAVP
ncbi:universal stress protein [Nannocystaceae bacterium ST9]